MTNKYRVSTNRYSEQRWWYFSETIPNTDTNIRDATAEEEVLMEAILEFDNNNELKSPAGEQTAHELIVLMKKNSDAIT